MPHSRSCHLPGRPPSNGGAALTLPLPPIRYATNIDRHLDCSRKMTRRLQPKRCSRNTDPPANCQPIAA